MDLLFSVGGPPWISWSSSADSLDSASPLYKSFADGWLAFKICCRCSNQKAVNPRPTPLPIFFLLVGFTLVVVFSFFLFSAERNSVRKSNLSIPYGDDSEDDQTLQPMERVCVSLPFLLGLGSWIPHGGGTSWPPMVFRVPGAQVGLPTTTGRMPRAGRVAG